MSKPVEVLLTGDLVLEVAGADGFFDLSRDALARADLRIGHLETPHTLRGELIGPAGCAANDPAELRALGRAGFEMVTLAANHIFDRGIAGVEDTLAALDDQGIATAGAGLDLASAQRPAIVERDGVTIGVLSYNCVGPPESWASAKKGGCAYVQCLTHYEPGRNPGDAPRVRTFADQAQLEAMQDAIADLKTQVDVAIVALHKGALHAPAVVLDYERQLARCAIDAGADAVVGHHAHILRGIDVYKGRPIFHGLGNFVTVTQVLDPLKAKTEGQRDYARRRRLLYGFEPDPDYPLYPFHPEARNAMVATLMVDRSGVRESGFLPCWIHQSGAPEILSAGERSNAVAGYVADITARAGLRARFERRGDQILVHAASAGL